MTHDFPDSEARYQSVIAAMSEGVVLQDANAEILACNASAERLLGLSAEQMAGRSSLDPRWRAIHPDGSPFPGETHPAVNTLRTGLPERGTEMGVYKPDGTLTWISINAQPLFREGECKPYAVVSTFSDITDRKRAERDQRQSEERYRSIVETSVEGIWTIDLQGRTTFANERMARMLRCSNAELARSSLWDFIDPSDHGFVEDRMRRRERGEHEEHEFRFVAKDGRQVWGSLAACAITLPDGRPGALAMVRDITEQKQLLGQLYEARRLEAIGRLAGGIAHDFNNLLTAILASASLAQRMDGQCVEHLETIREAGERAAALTKQLLAFARKQVIHVRPLDLNAVIVGLRSVLQRLVTEQIELVVDLAPDLSPVLGDTNQLEQVLVNLVANARDAMPEGGRVVIATRNVTIADSDMHGSRDVTPGDYAVLSVHDSGKGIDAEAREHLFEPFFTTKEYGTGLGLASCYGITKQLGGSICVTSAEGAGTTFDVYLPRSSGHASAPAPAGMSSVGGHETLLIAEDDDAVRRTLQYVLSAAGYTVLAARDGEHALALATAHHGEISLLITDVVMPKLSGRQLAERLTALRPEVQVLFVSGYLDQVVLPEPAVGAPLQFLAKPYRVDDLLQKVRELIEHRRSPR